MNTPKKLYKYEPFTAFSLRNLKRQSIYFSTPKNFNDPYDCAIAAEIQDLDNEQIDIFRNHLYQKYGEETARIADFELLGETITRIAKELIDSEREKYIDKIGVTCLSATNDDLLMWAHYGGCYKGFCLEFDTKYEPFNNAQKVDYLLKIPAINPLSILINDADRQFLQLFCSKSISWSYEKEWRIIHNKVGTLYCYPPESLTAIYFGPDIEMESLEIIALIINGQNPNVKFYQGKRSAKYFKIEFGEPIIYTSHIDAKNLGLIK